MSFRSVVILLIVLGFPIVEARGQLTAVGYESLPQAPASATLTFEIAFWSDPDLSEDDRASLNNRFNYLLGDGFRTALAEDLAGCGFSEIVLYPIDDYATLIEEGGRGRFDLIFCGPGDFASPGGLAESYTVLAERVPSGERKAGIWVREDSPIRAPRGSAGKDLEARHVAMAHRNDLFGGGLQVARLADGTGTARLRPEIDYAVTQCGSVSDAILRLITGLASERPVEAAFLPLKSPGFFAVRKQLNLPRSGELPIRLIAEFPAEEIPGDPLLIARGFVRYVELHRPGLRKKIETYFLERVRPWKWRESSDRRYEPLRDLLSLPDRGAARP